jgi:hypothetical protein
MLAEIVTVERGLGGCDVAEQLFHIVHDYYERPRSSPSGTGESAKVWLESGVNRRGCKENGPAGGMGME